MKIRCDYCDNFISDTDETCPHCGAPNSHLRRSASGVPRTIEELRAFAAAHNLPLEKMRFFLGQDIREPRAFGIYQDADGLFVVYKNKANGERAVRYRGRDEAYAVNELWQKMRSEVQNQKSRLSASRTAGSVPRRKKKWYEKPALLIVAIFFGISLISGIVEYFSPDRGYYSYDGGYYYYDTDNWFLYDAAADDWYETDVGFDSPLYSQYGDYYEGESYSSGSAYGNFYDSDYYADSYSSSDSSDWDSDWDDSDWDWDSGDDWDSGSTDWDSDW